MIQIKRVYDGKPEGDGKRFLVERLWPRGIKKEDLPMEAWLKNVAPSSELRKWFNHDPEKWGEFQKRYREELSENSKEWEPILNAAKKGKVTLLYSAHDKEHNNAIVLLAFLKEKLGQK